MEKLEFKIIEAGVALETTKLKVKASLEDIEKKHPGREDIIKSMTETLNDLWNVQAVFNWLREKRETNELEKYKIESENADLKAEVKKLKKELQDIKNNLTL
jgi:predicted nuclease with TOPRIM domain